jgi:hypothetical protein
MCLAIRKLRSDTTSKIKAPSPWHERIRTRVAAFKQHRTTTATIRALKDFQEAQIFFSLTLNIASLIALYQSKTRLMAPTVAELVANRFLFKVIGAIGSYPVVLNLCILRHNPRVLSRFILIASFCCLVLATLTWSLAIATTMRAASSSGKTIVSKPVVARTRCSTVSAISPSTKLSSGGMSDGR